MYQLLSLLHKPCQNRAAEATNHLLCLCRLAVLIYFSWDGSALAGVAEWIEYRPVNQKVAGSIPGKGICLGCGPGPQLGVSERQWINVSLERWCFSPSLFSFLLPFLKVNKILKKKKKAGIDLFCCLGLFSKLAQWLVLYGLIRRSGHCLGL